VYARVAGDEGRLEEVLGGEGGVIEEDELGGLIRGVHIRAREMRRERGEDVGRLEMGIWRSDYMVSEARDDEQQRGSGTANGGEALQLKQVGFNTMACPGACHGDRVADMHRHSARTGAYDPPLGTGDGIRRPDHDTSGSIPPSAYTPENMPYPVTATSLVSVLTAAHEAYDDLFCSRSLPDLDNPGSASRPTTCVLILSQTHNINLSDELPFLTSLWSLTPAIPTYTATFPPFALLSSTHLDPINGILTFRPPFSARSYEVAVLYWRAGHEVHEYTGIDGLGGRECVKGILPRYMREKLFLGWVFGGRVCFVVGVKEKV